MKENVIPKWQRELGSFIGIKSGIILEGNVYDVYPIFENINGEYNFLAADDLNTTVFNLTDYNKTKVVFFDPIVGFYSNTFGEEKVQKSAIEFLFEGYDTQTATRSHGYTFAFMPVSKKGCKGGNAEYDKYIWASEIIRRAVADYRGDIPQENLQENSPDVVTKNIIFIINFASRLDVCNLRAADANTMFLNLMAATTIEQNSIIDRNSLIMVVDKYNDIPAWVYMNNPNIHTITIGTPDRSVRKMFLNNLCGELERYKGLSSEENEAGKKFVAETEGLRLKEMEQILRLAYKKGIDPDNISTAFRLYKYGVLDNPWDKLDKDIVSTIRQNLEKRVKGQDEALEKVNTVVMRAVKGLSGLQHSGASHKPRGILFFAGPTGVGKTETAKALAESIFGDENACIRFDMSEYRLEQSDQKLFGAPPGYVGYEGGGQLTNAIKERPFSIILFDEIEKASPTILDKFLQILEDGRMTDNQGNTVYFGESIIIFTSNIGLTKDEEPANIFGGTPHKVPTITVENPMEEDTLEFRQRVTDLLTEGVKNYFTDIGRPELLNRLGTDNIVVFQFINKKDAENICDYKLNSICDVIRSDFNINIDISAVIDYLHEKAVLERANGGRGVGNMLEREFLNPFSRCLCSFSENPQYLSCYLTENGIGFMEGSNYGY